MNERLPPALLDYLGKLEPAIEQRIEILELTDAELLPLPAGVSKIACYTDRPAGRQYRIAFDQLAMGTVRIDVNRREVTKTIVRYGEFGILAREVAWLRALAGSGVAPELLATDASSLTLGYVGEPVRRYNLPPDWADQAEAILAALGSAGCSHNDIKCDNLTVLDGRLFLIDFGFATPIGDPIPPSWPKGIGRQHRLGVHSFDDRHAIFAALRSAERDEVDRSVVMTG